MAAYESLPKAPPTEGSEPRPPARGVSKFRVVTAVIQALKRFQGALNPTYEFGSYKHREEDGQPTPALMKANSQRVYSTPAPGLVRSVTGNRATSGRTSSGRPAQVGVHYGHKGNLLFKPLPEQTA